MSAVVWTNVQYITMVKVNILNQKDIMNSKFIYESHGRYWNVLILNRDPVCQNQFLQRRHHQQVKVPHKFGPQDGDGQSLSLLWPVWRGRRAAGLESRVNPRGQSGPGQPLQVWPRTVCSAGVREDGASAARLCPNKLLMFLKVINTFNTYSSEHAQGKIEMTLLDRLITS